jgi:manganese efflux pump family protein
MSLFGIFLLAVALAADSFAASMAKGSQLYRPSIRDAVTIAAVFAVCQVLMPLIGWQVGVAVQPLVERIDHWIAFAILAGLGGKLIYDGLHADGSAYTRNTLTFTALILSAVATSIDSLVVGFGFGFINLSILAALATIGAVTFAVSVAGVYLGRYAGGHLGEYVEVGAGFVLIVVGTGILYDHLAA